MKYYKILLCSLFYLVSTGFILGQESEFLIHPLHDMPEEKIKASDTIPDYFKKEQPVKIQGTIYQADGVTPAKNVILYIEQADENGDFDLRKVADRRYVYHRAWVKTDANGQYTLYTFIPGNDRRYNRLQELFPSIKEPSKPVYDIESFLFDEDPMLSKLCRKRLAKKGDPSRILSFKRVDDVLVATKDIVLKTSHVAAK